MLETAADASGPDAHAAFLDAQKSALEMVVRGEPLPDTLSYLAGVVEQESDRASVSAILLLDGDGRLWTGGAPSLPHSYNSAIDGLRAQPALGTCSAAAATGCVVITQDFESDPAWATLKSLPLALGLVAAWSQPILNRQGRVLGTFGTYFRERRGPTRRERRVVEILSHTAALAIERARAEEAQRTEERRKDEFIATLSHELRNPLAPLRTGVQLLSTVAGDREGVLRLQARMSRQIEQLVRLVDDLLDISRVTRGDLQLRHELVNLLTVVDTALESTAPMLQKGHFAVSVSRPDLPVTAIGDPLRLGQIVGNVLSNAAKYTEPGGSIAIAVRRGDGCVEVAVTDSGIGIDDEDAERIFEPFVRVQRGGVEAQWGLGLGLPLARRLAAIHGGTLTVTSAGHGQGSEFVLRLPSAD